MVVALICKFTDNNSVLDFYKQYSSFTDPGEYAYLYKNFSDSLPELCRLIKSQFMHPFSELHLSRIMQFRSKKLKKKYQSDALKFNLCIYYSTIN